MFRVQLLKIKPKGWTKDVKFEVSEFQPRQALMSDKQEKEKQNAKVEGETETLEVKELKDLGAEVQVMEVEDNELEKVYVVYEMPQEEGFSGFN